MSKTLIVLIVGITGLLAVGCASTPTMKSVAGTYEGKRYEANVRLVFLDNGVFEAYENGEKLEEDKWKIVDGDIHVVHNILGFIGPHIYRVNRDGSITLIASDIYQINGKYKRQHYREGDWRSHTLKKIK